MNTPVIGCIKPAPRPRPVPRPPRPVPRPPLQ